MHAVFYRRSRQALKGENLEEDLGAGFAVVDVPPFSGLGGRHDLPPDSNGKHVGNTTAGFNWSPYFYISKTTAFICQDRLETD
jgi:hypothetical protein